jgi:6-phosphofructokinase 1
MNAAIRAVVRTGAYFDLHTYGILNGYEGLIDGKVRRLEKGDVGNIIHRGGTILKTARSERFRTKEGRKSAFETLEANDIDALIAIGGDGTFTGAKIFQEEFGIPVIGVPGTIDNDLFGTDYTIGFDTAVNTAIEAVDKIRDTADSHNRLFFVEVMGRHSGYIALHTAIGSGAGGVVIPEAETKLEDLVHHLEIARKRGKLFSVIIVAEGSSLGGATELAQKVKAQFDHFETKVTVIGHLQRGGSPTSMDRVLASHLGYAAVKGLLQGQSSCMAGQVDGDIVYTSFEDAIGKLKAPEKELIEMAKILSM